MLSKKDFEISAFVIFCILLNFIGKFLAHYFYLPLWLDSIGTVFASYALGGICGSIVGVTVNVIYSGFQPISYIYSITSMAIAVTVGILTKKLWFRTFFGTMTASVLVTVISVTISVALSWIVADGMTSNLWGDGVIKYLEEQGVPAIFSSIIGQFYIDFLDKVITLTILYLAIKAWRKRIRFLRTVLSFSSDFGQASKVLAIFFISSLFFLLPVQKIQAQPSARDFTSYVQTVYSNENGIPCGEANDIAQTKDGILWIGTYAGLYRYNGSEFRWMKNYDSVRNVNCLYVDEEGRLWIGTNDNGLSICINEKIVNTLNDEDGLPSNSVRSIVKGSDGYFYVGTSVGILVLELNSGLRVCNIIKEVGNTISLSTGSDGFVAAVTSRGQLFVLNESEVRYSFSLGIKGENFTCCEFGNDGTLYAGTSKNHIYHYKISEKESELIDTYDCASLNYLKRIFFDDDRIFVCSDSGIGYFDFDAYYKSGILFRKINTGDFNNSIDNMTIDYQGNYWFTSSRKGLLRLSSSSFVNLYGSLGLPSKVVNTTCEWNGSLFVGTDSGLDIIDIHAPQKAIDSKIKSELLNYFSNVRIRCIKSDSKNNLWASTYGRGLVRVSKNGKITTFDDSEKIGSRVRVSTELSDGTIVGAGINGIAFIKNDEITESISFSRLGTAMVLTLMEMNDGSGRILAGTDGNGIIVINSERKAERILTQKDGLTSNVILRTVNAPHEKGVFVVTSNSICHLTSDSNSDSEFSIRALNSFPYFNNYDIQVNQDGALFILSSAGLYVVDSDSLITSIGKLQYDLLDSKSGLNSMLTANSWNYVSDNGILYLSCSTGVYVVDMNNYIFGKLSYHMMVSSLELDSVSVVLDRSEPLTIGRNVSKIEFFPEVVNYTVLDPFVSYYLEGFDASPIVIPQSQLSKVVYTNLPSGNYKFHLSVFDKNQNVLEESTYELVKEKEIYDTTYFRIYLVTVAMLAIAWLTWFLVRNQLQKKFETQRRKLEFVQNQVKMGNETILAIAKTVDAKDENTSQHSMRVSEYSVMLAREMGFSEEECENLRKAALLHDIGKIGIPDRILNKPSRLDDDEYAIMKSHVTRGAEILKDFTMIEHVRDGVLYHHEKYDGTGYPQGLKGEAIPLYGRIIGVADAFDAMTANRVYRKQLDFDFVVAELKRCRGTQFDPKIADIMLGLIENGKIDVEALYKKSKEHERKPSDTTASDFTKNGGNA